MKSRMNSAETSSSSSSSYGGRGGSNGDHDGSHNNEGEIGNLVNEGERQLQPDAAAAAAAAVVDKNEGAAMLLEDNEAAAAATADSRYQCAAQKACRGGRAAETSGHAPQQAAPTCEEDTGAQAGSVCATQMRLGGRRPHRLAARGWPTLQAARRQLAGASGARDPTREALALT